jgi:hypothetical protein
MNPGVRNAILAAGLLASASALVSCGKPSAGSSAKVDDPHLGTVGTVEVTARLVEVPDGAIFKRDLYNYATILKYEIIKVHRGQIDAKTIFVGHYNPWKPRAEASDNLVKGVGGDLKQFRAGQVHRMAMEAPMDEYYMGGIVNKYFGQDTGTLYWAMWTNLADE